jgi:hypothetical protein
MKKTKKWQVTDTVAGTVGYTISAPTRPDAVEKAKELTYSLGCLEHAESVCLSVAEAPDSAPLDRISKDGNLVRRWPKPDLILRVRRAK